MFTINDFKLPSGDIVGTLSWTYTNVEGSISGTTPISLDLLSQINPATVSPSSVQTWLGGNAGNTIEQLDAAIAKRVADAAAQAEQVEYEIVDGEWVEVAEEVVEEEEAVEEEGEATP